MLDTMSTITPTPIGPFTLRSQPKTLNQLQKTVINAHKNCERELRRLLPLPDDHVTNDPIRRPFSQLKREREKAYAEVSVLEQYKETLNKLLSLPRFAIQVKALTNFSADTTCTAMQSVTATISRTFM